MILDIHPPYAVVIWRFNFRNCIGAGQTATSILHERRVFYSMKDIHLVFSF